LLPRAHSPCRSVLDYYSKAAPEMQAFFSIFLRFFQKSLFQTLLRVKTCKRRAPRRGRAGRCKGVFGFGVSEKNRNLWQHRIILSANTASEVRQMLSQKRR